jgi:hypothetical protein
MTGKPRKKALETKKTELERMPLRKLVASVKSDLKQRIRKAVESGDLPRNWKNR